MLKLIKYEFRKSLAAVLVLLGVAAGLECYFLGAMALNRDGHVVGAAALLMLCAYAVFIFVFVRGLSTYSSELKNRSAYLIFMTPNSGLKIMASKYLYTCLNALLLGLLVLCVFAADVAAMLHYFGEWEDLVRVVNQLLTSMGVYMDQLGLILGVMSLYTILQSLSFFALAYLAITISHTLFRDKKWRWIAAVGLFILLDFLLSTINGLLPSPVEGLVVIDAQKTTLTAQQLMFSIITGISAEGMTEPLTTGQMMTGMVNLLPRLIPSTCVSLVCVLGSLFGCGWMLDRKVSL